MGMKLEMEDGREDGCWRWRMEDGDEEGDGE